MSMDPDEPGPEGFAVVIRTPGGFHKAVHRKEDIRGFEVVEVWIFGAPLTKAQIELLREIRPAIKDDTGVHYINASRHYRAKTAPLLRTFEKQEVVDKMTLWMIDLYGHPREQSEAARSAWHERNGMLHHFITDLFDK